jgi:uncharacterized membrane protein
MPAEEFPTRTRHGRAATPSAPAATPTATEDEKTLSAVSYILTWLTGLIIFFVAKKDQRYARWNAIQAIGLGVAGFALAIIFNVLWVAFAFGGATGFAIGSIFAMLSWPVWIALIVLVIVCAVKAYQGSPIRLPLIAPIADRNA